MACTRDRSYAPVEHCRAKSLPGEHATQEYASRLVHLTNAQEVLVLAAQRVHERIRVFRPEVLIGMQMESNGLKRGLAGVVHNRRPRWLHAGLHALRPDDDLCGSHPIC